MVNPIKSLRESLGKIPTKYRFWTSLGILAALLIALPVTLIGLMTGTFELRKMATGEVVPTPYPCECRSGVDNFCLYPPQTLNCPMTFPGGYCDPNGDASFDDADWEGGYYEYQRLCGGAPITPGPASCGQSCGPDAPCAPGLMCGTPCQPGQVCAQYMRCYNPNCPYDKDCICGGTPTAIPCTPEGQTMPVYPGYSCCPGLEAISPNKPDAKGNCPDHPLLGASVCVKDCGNGQCTLGENKCNCPEDCRPTPTATPVSCNEDDKGVFSVEYYTRSDGLPGLKVKVVSNTFYQNVSLGVTQAGAGKLFEAGPSILGASDFHYEWLWDIVKPPVDNFTLTFYVNRTPQENGESCGQWVSSQALKFKVIFRGVTSRPPDDSDKEVKIYATNLTSGPDLGSADNKKSVILSVDDSGIYYGEITLSGDYFGHRYRLRIKGPKHLQSVFPDEFFQAGEELDLTSSPLRPGDLDQDGDVDINDLRAVKVFSTNPTDIAFGDVNFDGKLSVFDRALILITLSVQYDPD